MSLLLYLPLALMGRAPSLSSWLTFVPTSRYYLALVALTPVVLLTQWLTGSVVVHCALRVAKRRSDIDAILNITGMTALVIGSLSVAVDWLYVYSEFANYYLLGLIHCAFYGWAVVLSAYCLKKSLDLPYRIGIAANLFYLAAAIPSEVLFMRAPV